MQLKAETEDKNNKLKLEGLTDVVDTDDIREYILDDIETSIKRLRDVEKYTKMVIDEILGK